MQSVQMLSKVGTKSVLEEKHEIKGAGIRTTVISKTRDPNQRNLEQVGNIAKGTKYNRDCAHSKWSKIVTTCFTTVASEPATDIENVFKY